MKAIRYFETYTKLPKFCRICLKPVPQDGDQRQISRGHGVISQVLGMHPSEFLSLEPGDDSLPLAAGEQGHQQVEIGISMTGERERGQAAGESVDVEFFFEFADQRRFGRFAGVYLAAGKFPKASHGFTFRALGEQNTAIGVYQGHGRDEDNVHARLSLPGAAGVSHPRTPLGYLGQNEMAIAAL